MSEVIRVNAATKEITREGLKPEYKPYGNRGLVAKILKEEVNPGCGALGPENKIIICTGILAGTTVTTAHRLSIGCKSPLTGGAKEANSGGIVARMMAQHGIRAFIIEDKPADEDGWKLLKVNADGFPELIDADEYVGMGNYALSEALQEKYGDSIGIASIGIAGERMNKIATVQITDFTTKHPARSAARGGIGAVMGSKKIKALVIEKPKAVHKFEYKDKEKFDSGNKKLFAALQGPMVDRMTEGGTCGNLELQSEPGILSVRNFSGEYYGDRTDSLRRDKWLERINLYGGKQGIPCQPGCVLKCSNAFYNKNGKFVTSALEYETLALCGPNLNISSWDFVAEIDRMCDDYGIDTVDFGGGVGLLMDEGVIEWGDEAAVKELCGHVYAGDTDLGRLLAEGAYEVGKAIGAKRIPVVKRQCLAGYDPRNMKGIGVTYATSTMGADHTAGLTGGPGDHINKEGKVQDSQGAQIFSAASDNFMCSFGFFFSGDFSIFLEILSGALGGEWDMPRLMGLGVETLLMEREFNLAAGLTPEDDVLPEFFYKEASPHTNSAFDISPEEMQKVYDF